MAIKRAGLLLLALLVLCAPLSAQFVVMSLADIGDDDLDDNVYTPQTLRSAIQNANKLGVPASITISPTLGETNAVLTLSSALPPINVPCVFEGKGLTITGGPTKIGNAGLFFTGSMSELRNVKVENIRGSGIVWQGSDGIIENVIVRYCEGPGINLNGAKRNIIGSQLSGYYSVYIYGCTGNGGNGISLIVGSSYNEIRYCAIGVNEQYQRVPNSRNGILLEDPDNHIHHNLISGNDWDGISADGRGRALNLRIEKNYIGTNDQATDSISNGGNGISISSSSSDVIQNNVVSGNKGNGIFIANAQSRLATIQNNIVGTDKSTKNPVPNGAGIQLNGADHTVIDNIVSGNLGTGIGLSSNTTEVTGNIIGLDSSQTVAVGNGGAGIRAQFISNAVIGTGDTTIPANVIAANGGSGIVIGSASIANVTITGNVIGTNEMVTTPFPNKEHGVLIRYNVENIEVIDNLIASNAKNGVQIERNVVRFLDTTRPNLYQRPKNVRILKNWIGYFNKSDTVFHHGGHGVSVHNADSVEITKNYIIGCQGDGIHVQSDTTRDILILDNLIGAPLHYPASAINLGAGVKVRQAQRVTIGSPIDPELANDILRNQREGVMVAEDAQIVSVYQNHICMNMEGGIVLGDRDSYYFFGADDDPLDADKGPNDDQNTPQIYIGREEAGKLRVAGLLYGKPGETYRIDVYLDRERAPADEYNVQGCDDLAWFVKTAPAGDGIIRFDERLDIANLAARMIENPIVSTTATGTDGTSPFSLAPYLPPGDTSKHAVDVMVTIDTLETGVDGQGTAELTAWITNRGFDPAFNVVVSDTVNPAFSADSLGISRGTIALVDGVVTAVVPQIAPLETIRYRVVGRALQIGDHERHVRATVTSFDVFPSNNVDSVTMTADVVNSVEDVNRRAVAVAPNPVQRELTVYGTSLGYNSRYRVASITGGVVIQGAFNESTPQVIDVSSLVPGVYVLHISDPSDSTLRSAVFVKE